MGTSELETCETKGENCSQICRVFLQLEDDHTLFDYDIGVNATVQIIVRQKIVEPSPKKTPKNEDSASDKENLEVRTES